MGERMRTAARGGEEGEEGEKESSGGDNTERERERGTEGGRREMCCEVA